MAVTITDASLQGIYNRLHAIPEYHPLDAQTFADWSVEAGDVVTVSRENDSYSSPVHTSRMVWKGSPETQLTSGGNKQRDPVSTVSQKKYRRGSAARRSQEIIQSTLEDKVDDVRSIVTQMANQWSVIVEGTGQNAHIKPAAIQASIDTATGTSKIKLSADNIELDGETFANYFATGSLTLQDVDIYEGSDIFVGDDSALYIGSDVGMYYGGSYHPFSYCLANAEVSNDKVHFTHMNGDELQIYINNDGELVFKDAEGHELSFEKAVYPGTITGIACPNGAVTDGQTRTNGTVEASGTDITNDPYSVSFSMNYESFRPQGTSIDTAAVYFMLDGVKIGRYADGNLLEQNIKKDVVIMGITGTYQGTGGSGTITSISCPSGAVGTGQERRSGKVQSSGTNISNDPYEVDFSMGYESFRPQSTSIDTAAVYFMLNGVKIGRYADSNLVKSNIKKNVSILGITGSYVPSARFSQPQSPNTTITVTVDGISGSEVEAHIARDRNNVYIIDGIAYNASTSKVYAKYSMLYYDGNEINTSENDQTLLGGRFLTGNQVIKGVKTAGISAENIKKGVVVTVGDENDPERIKNVTGSYGLSDDIDIYRFDYKSDSEPSGSSWNNLPDNTGVDKPLVISKKEAWYELAIDVATDANSIERKWYKVPIEISGKGDCVSENIRKGKSICGVNGSLNVTQTAPWANQIGSNAERKTITMEADAKQSTFKLVKNTVTYQGASIPCVELRDSSSRAVGRFFW